MRVRRTAYAFFYLEDQLLIDFAALLRGHELEPAPDARLLAICILDGERHELTPRELELLRSVPSERWVEASGPDEAALAGLCGKGLLLTDADDERSVALRERDQALSANEWNLYAATYHYMTQWAGVEIPDGDLDEVRLNESTGAAARALVAAHGLPPGEFAEPRAGETVSLPGRRRTEPLFATLERRRTTRRFDAGAVMTQEALDAVLMYVFGAHGYTTTAAGVVCIKRTSPSGGGLHPIEVYPIISNVEGISPGIYHYNGRDHSLSLIVPMEPEAARSMTTSFVCGQGYFGDAHVSFVLTARFYRNHWKYRRHQKAYAGILMDAAHLSQTLYLVSAELDLGAYVTIAINSRDIERRLELDGVSEGVLAVLGCGPRAPGLSPLEPQFSSRARARSTAASS